MIALHEARGEPRPLLENALVVAFEEKAARVLEHPGLEQENFGQRGRYDVHAACVIYASMNPGERSLLFLGKAEDAHTARAAEFCRRNFADVSTHAGRWDDPLPETAAGWSGGLIVSYLARWIVPAPLLARAALALNFHPGPPEYPGYGCNNFAIYEGAREYGVTCHHMAPRVDTGAIVEVLRFPVLDVGQRRHAPRARRTTSSSSCSTA